MGEQVSGRRESRAEQEDGQCLHVEHNTSLAGEKGTGSLAVGFHGNPPEFCS